MRAARNKSMLVVAGVLLIASQSSHAGQAEQIIGGIDAVIVGCGPVDPKSAKTGAEMLERERVQRKLDLAVVRNSDDYKAVYNTELNRLLAMPPKSRIQACQTVW